MKSKIEINPEACKKCLIVPCDSVRYDYNGVIEAYYSPVRLNWEDAIDQALQDKGLESGQATIIVFPLKEEIKRIIENLD